MRGGLLLVWMAAAALAQPLSQGERDRAMSDLHATRKMFLDAVAGLSEAQWNFKPAADRWSIAEVSEHIALSEDGIFELITKKILATPAAPERKSEVAINDETLQKRIVDRSTKAQAPEFLRPTNRWKTQAELVDHFKRSRDRNIAWVQTTRENLREHFFAHPMFKLLDAYQWVLLLSGHSHRHTLQLNEVKEASGFPR